MFPAAAWDFAYSEWSLNAVFSGRGPGLCPGKLHGHICPLPTY